MRQIACTIDVSRRGARLAGVKGLKGPGQFIAVRRNTSEARFRVVWIGRPRTAQEGQVGIECVETDKIIWDVDFGKAQEDFELIGMAHPGPTQRVRSFPGTGAKPKNYSCPGTVEVWAEKLGSQCIEARLTAISWSGCQLNSVVGLSLNSQLLLQVQIGETQLTVKGILREQDGAPGAWIEFTHIRRGDRQILHALIARLSGRKRENIESQPVEELCGPDHVCLFYTSRAEHLAAVIPFIRAGLKRGERSVYIVDDNPTATIEDVRAAGIPVEDAIRAGALLILTKWDTYLKGGNFDPQGMLQYLQDQVAAARAAGFAALRVAGEVNWIQTKLDEVRLLEYEAKLNGIIPQTGLLAMCQYHRNCVGPEMILGILETHPRIVEKDGVHQNWLC